MMNTVLNNSEVSRSRTSFDSCYISWWILWFLLLSFCIYSHTI